MILPSCHLLFKQCRSSLLRTVVRRHLALSNARVKEQENRTSLQSTNFTQKGRELFVCSSLIRIAFLLAQQAVKETVYSLVVVAGVVALSGLCYLILHEFYSRETPNGIYKEASRMCLANIDVSGRFRTRAYRRFSHLGTRSTRCTDYRSYYPTDRLNKN